jgi:DNA-binding protein
MMSDEASEKDNNAVYVGRRPTMNYVMAAMVILNRNVNCVIKARGKAISHAVDVGEILKRKFFTTARYEEIRISTEVLHNDDGREVNVSSIEIEIAPQ